MADSLREPVDVAFLEKVIAMGNSVVVQDLMEFFISRDLKPDAAREYCLVFVGMLNATMNRPLACEDDRKFLLYSGGAASVLEEVLTSFQEAELALATARKAPAEG